MRNQKLQQAIERLDEMRTTLNSRAVQRIMDTGKGDLFLDGQVLGFNKAIWILEEMRDDGDDEVQDLR